MTFCTHNAPTTETGFRFIGEKTEVQTHTLINNRAKLRTMILGSPQGSLQRREIKHYKFRLFGESNFTFESKQTPSWSRESNENTCPIKVWLGKFQSFRTQLSLRTSHGIPPGFWLCQVPWEMLPSSTIALIQGAAFVCLPVSLRRCELPERRGLSYIPVFST